MNGSDNSLPLKMVNGNIYYKISVSDNGIGFDPKYTE
jgi:sensor histidine kinase YesM